MLSKLRYYDRRSSCEAANEEDLEADEADLEPQDIPSESSPVPNPRRTLVSVVADDSACEEHESASSDEVDFEVYSDDDEVLARRRRRASAAFKNHVDAELEDLESDEELEEPRYARKNRL